MTLQPNDYLAFWLYLQSGATTVSVSRWYFVTNATGTDPLQVACANLQSYVGGAIHNQMGSLTYYRHSKAERWLGGSKLAEYETTPTQLTRTNLSSPLPPFVCPVTSFRPLSGPPRTVSRLYWPWVPAHYTDSTGSLTTSAITALDNVAQALIIPLSFAGGLGSVDLLPVVYSKAYASGLQLGIAKTWNRIGTQRRRNLGNQKASWSP